MVKTMTAFFGIDENNSEKFFEQGVVCMDNSVEKKPFYLKHSRVSGLRISFVLKALLKLD